MVLILRKQESLNKQISHIDCETMADNQKINEITNGVREINLQNNEHPVKVKKCEECTSIVIYLTVCDFCHKKICSRCMRHCHGINGVPVMGACGECHLDMYPSY